MAQQAWRFATRLRTSKVPLGLGAVGAGVAYGTFQVQASQAKTFDEMDMDVVGGAVYGALINRKVNACPMAVRVAWHASGTFDQGKGTGGSDGATMRFEPEHSDPANAGLFIIHDLLLRVKERFTAVSYADLWTLAGAKAVEFMGGPRIEFKPGRHDLLSADQGFVPPNGLLPDASQGAAHLRDVFGRMGFNDRDIVALSGAHTVGRCHKVRSGYDGAWTTSPLRFDNEYFRNLMNLEWKRREWDGPLQYTDVKTETLTMLPTDMALRTDPSFNKIAREYADDQVAFFRDFSSAFSRLIAKGCPGHVQPGTTSKCPKARAAAEFRELSMHGSLEHMKRLMAQRGGVGSIDVNSFDADSGRTALHKAAFWGHDHVIRYLSRECLANVDSVDFAGDTALHDASRFGHIAIVQSLLDVGANTGVVNKDGHSPVDLAKQHGYKEVEAVIKDHIRGELAAVSRARRESFLLGGAPVKLDEVRANEGKPL